MDAAQTAINKLINGSSTDGEKPETVTEEVAPAVEHEQVSKHHEEKEQVVKTGERHQDHYHTTVQPLKDREVLPTEHEHEQANTQVREFEHDDQGVKDQVNAKNAQFESSSVDGGTTKEFTKEATIDKGETVHHHLHETIQPVIEKETVQPSVTHKTVPIHEIHKDPSVDQGTTTNSAISVDEFQRRLGGEKPTEKVVSNSESTI